MKEGTPGGTGGDQPIVIVSGLPRSGTSMMMRMLHAGGLELLTDGRRAADEDNPHGYFELEAVKRTAQDASWLAAAGGRPVKMISRLLFDLPLDRAFRILFMRRDLSEILASQRTMLERRGGAPSASIDDAEMGALYAAHLAEVKAWLAAQSRMRVLDVWYHEVQAAPLPQARRVAAFLDLGLDPDRMAGVVDPTLHRHRTADLRA